MKILIGSLILLGVIVIGVGCLALFYVGVLLVKYIKEEIEDMRD